MTHSKKLRVLYDTPLALGNDVSYTTPAPKANVGFMRIDDLRRSDFALLAQAGAELATMLEMTYTLGDMSQVNPEAVAVVTEVCWRLEEVEEDLPDEIAHLVCGLAGQGNTIAELRRANGMSRKDLATRLEISESLVKRIELRKAQPGPGMAQDFADAFDKRIEEVFPALIAWRRGKAK